MTWYAVGLTVGDVIPKWDLAEPIEFGGGLRIERVPDWIKHEAASRLLSWHDKEKIRTARSAFALEYEAEALGSPDPQWTGSQVRSIQSATDEKFSLAGIALWLVRTSLLSCGPVMHFGRKGEPDSMRMSGTLLPILVRTDETNNVLTGSEVEFGGQIFGAILALPRDGTRWLALRMLVRALTERMWEIRFLLLWVVLEALFGPDDPHETTHRISQRIALFLSGGGPEGLRVYREVKDGYHWRSRVVHGARIKKLTGPKSDELVMRAEIYIRATLVRTLMDPELAAIFDSAKREDYLESLAFISPK